MKVKGKQDLKPQVEEDIHEIKWLSPGDLGPYLENSFPSVRDLLLKFKI
jgi:hypothetical protein